MAIKVGGTTVIDNSRNISNIANLATVATSGAYSDLSGSPSGDSLLPSQSGNTGKFLTSNGSAASWADAGGGAYELIQKTSISSNVTTVSFNSISAPQAQLLLLFNHVKLDSDGHIRMQYKDSSYNLLQAANSYNSTSFKHDAFGSSAVGSSSFSHTNFTEGTTLHGGSDFSGYFYFTGFGTGSPSFDGASNYQRNSNGRNFASNKIASKYYGSGIPTRLYIFNSANYFTAGDIFLYKLV